MYSEPVVDETDTSDDRAPQFSNSEYSTASDEQQQGPQAELCAPIYDGSPCTVG